MLAHQAGERLDEPRPPLTGDLLLDMERFGSVPVAVKMHDVAAAAGALLERAIGVESAADVGAGAAGALQAHFDQGVEVARDDPLAKGLSVFDQNLPEGFDGGIEVPTFQALLEVFTGLKIAGFDRRIGRVAWPPRLEDRAPDHHADFPRTFLDAESVDGVLIAIGRV